MREIKFRAWHKKYKKYYEVHHLHVGAIGNHEGIWATCKAYDCIEQKDIYIQIQPNDCIIEQFTGLKDKNGKEIYEGDVLSQGEARFIVKWDDSHAMFKCYFENQEEHYCNLNDSYIHEFFEVIGNIHENKE